MVVTVTLLLRGAACSVQRRGSRGEDASIVC